MRLVPKELDKLVLHQAGTLAQKRLARGVKLNDTEATALIASQLVEVCRVSLLKEGACLTGPDPPS